MDKFCFNYIVRYKRISKEKYHEYKGYYFLYTCRAILRKIHPKTEVGKEVKKIALKEIKLALKKSRNPS